MSELIFPLAIIIVGFVAGWYVREWYAMRIMKQLVNKASESYKQSIRESIVNAYVEKSGDEYFVYRKDDNAFLAKGKDIDDLTDILQEKFPGKYFNIPNDQLEMLEAKQ